jgi:aspartokinase-like uncharacterized kinase
VKIGGSLATDPLLADWLQLLAPARREPIVIVPGGGGFADCVREHQARWRFADAAAHRMALLAMAQYGLMLAAIEPSLVAEASVSKLAATREHAAAAVWLPLDLVRGTDGIDESWEITSDSLAAWLARELGATKLIVVKSCALPPRATIDQLVEADIVDRRFGTFVRDAALDVDVVTKHDVDQARALLDG